MSLKMDKQFVVVSVSPFEFQVVDSESNQEFALVSEFEEQKSGPEERANKIASALNYHNKLKHLLGELCECAAELHDPSDTDTYRDALMLLEEIKKDGV